MSKSKSADSNGKTTAEQNSASTPNQQDKPATPSLLDLVADTESLMELERVRPSANETAIICFTGDYSSVALHYCPEPDFNNFIRCNEDGCILCKIGRKQDQRYLLPVYLPVEGTVGILPVSPSRTPHALLPQLINVLKAKKPQVCFLRREGRYKFILSTIPLNADIDAGESQIEQFNERFERGEIDPLSIYLQIDNDQLAEIPEIANMLRLKGL
jgi:hypothetical protein